MMILVFWSNYPYEPVCLARHRNNMEASVPKYKKQLSQLGEIMTYCLFKNGMPKILYQWPCIIFIIIKKLIKQNFF